MHSDSSFILLFILPRLLGSGKQNLAVLNLSVTTVLSYSNLENSISESGTVESAMSMAVYSTLSYPVMRVSVDVGDYVEEGDLLAQLDGESIQDQISSQEVSLAVATQSSTVSQKTAQDNYDNYKEGLDSGLNSSLLSVQTQADSAYDIYIKAQNAYDRYSENLDKGENSSLLSAQSALNTAKSALSTAQASYDSANSALTAAKEALQTAECDKAQAAYDAALQSLTDAQIKYNTQLKTYNAANTTADDTLIDYEIAAQNAWDSYQAALKRLEAAKKVHTGSASVL